jgi:hypothetical protein
VKLHGHAAGLVALLDPGWRRKLFVAGLWLFVPVLGWPAVLGWRARFVVHLFAPLPAALPAVQGAFLVCVGAGLRAIAVIFAHLLPLYAALCWLLLQRGFCPDGAWFALAAFFVAFPIFSTLSLPAACVLLAVSPRHWLSAGEAAAFALAFALVVFAIPAGFLEVSRTGRHRSAFAFWRTLPFVCRHLRAYCGAWWRSGAMSLLGHLALPLSPWGVVWCYLGILVLFNELLVHTGRAPGEGWLARALADPQLQGDARVRVVGLRDAAGEPVTALALRWFSVPLPRRLTIRARGRSR